MDYSTGALFNYEVMTIVIIAIIIGFFLFFAFFINSYLPFKHEINYIKMEISRSFEKEEYLYWKRKLKKLYLSCIPIIGKFLK